MSYVYFITNGNHIKIGKANNIDKRLKQLQTGSSNELSVCKFIVCKNSREAFIVETYFHNKFKDKKVQGEWFDINIESVDTNISSKTISIMTLLHGK